VVDDDDDDYGGSTNHTANGDIAFINSFAAAIRPPAGKVSSAARARRARAARTAITRSSDKTLVIDAPRELKTHRCRIIRERGSSTLCRRCWLFFRPLAPFLPCTDLLARESIRKFSSQLSRKIRKVVKSASFPFLLLSRYRSEINQGYTGENAQICEISRHRQTSIICIQPEGRGKPRGGGAIREGSAEKIQLSTTSVNRLAVPALPRASAT